MDESKTQKGLRLMREQGMSAYAAAKAAGITTPTLYAAVKREQMKAEQGICPTCHQVVRQGFVVTDRLSQAITTLDRALAKGERLTVDDVVAYLKQMRES